MGKFGESWTISVLFMLLPTRASRPFFDSVAVGFLIVVMFIFGQLRQLAMQRFRTVDVQLIHVLKESFKD